MSHKRPAPAKASEPGLSQVTGARKDQFLRGLVQGFPGLDEGLAAKFAEYLSRSLELVKAERSLVEHHLRPKPTESQPKARPFDPYSFSLMKVYRVSGERGVREKLRGIEESSHLQALAIAQKISLPVRLRAEGADVAGLKDAIVRGVIGRFEDWQAAS
jgi:hypothetical protein